MVNINIDLTERLDRCDLQSIGLVTKYLSNQPGWGKNEVFSEQERSGRTVTLMTITHLERLQATAYLHARFPVAGFLLAHHEPDQAELMIAGVSEYPDGFLKELDDYVQQNYSAEIAEASRSNPAASR